MESKSGMLQKLRPGRVLMMILGNLVIGIGVASYRLSLFGVDPFSCMNLGISGFLGLSFGNWQLIMNVLILIVVFFCIRSLIGLGTVINMVFIGYIADFVCWAVQDVMGMQAGLPMRLLFLGIGTLFASFGCAMYMNADLGIAPYDSVAFIVTNLTNDKVSFRAARICSDVTVMAVGVGFCLAAHNNVWEIVGLGTVVNAFCNGPLIQFFRSVIGRKS